MIDNLYSLSITIVYTDYIDSIVIGGKYTIEKSRFFYVRY